MKIRDERLEELKSYPVSFRIRKLRCLLGITQKEFASKINFSSTSVILWENGKVSPSQLALEKIITSYDLPVDFFLDIEIERMR